MPEKTIEAFADHGTVARTVDADVDEAKRLLGRIEDAGVSMEDVTKQLQEDGVQAFSESVDELLDTLAGKIEAVGARGAA
jgi:transaldolase